MKCVFCGAEIDDAAAFCPNCGRQLRENTVPVTGTVVNPDGTPVSGGFRAHLLNQDKALLLVLAILSTVSAGASFIAGGLSTIPLFPVLYTIFLWLIYSKFSAGEIHSKAIRWVSGTVFAEYVFAWIGAVILGLAGLILLLGGSVLGIGTSVLDEIMDSAELSEPLSSLLLLIPGGITAVIMVLGIGLLVAAVLTALFNQLGTRKIHRFVQSLYQSAENDRSWLVDPKAAATWMLVFGIFEAISAVSVGGLGLLAVGCSAAAHIVGYVIVKKAFVDQAQ